MTAAPRRPAPAPAPLSARLGQGAIAVLPAIISVLLMVTTHRWRVELGPVEIPAGLLLGAAYQVATCVFLWAMTASRMPLVVLGALWGLLATPFLGQGAGGGVLMPAVIGEQAQFSGWIVQALGFGIPFAAAGWITLRRRRR